MTEHVETLGGATAPQGTPFKERADLEAIQADFEKATGIRWIRGPYYENREMRRRRSSGEERRGAMRRNERFERMVQKTARAAFARYRKIGGK